jgi:hypothetical protein
MRNHTRTYLSPCPFQRPLRCVGAQEYTRSLEEYQEKYHPKDEQLGDVVLR